MNFSVIITIILLVIMLIAIGLAVLFGFRRNIVQTGVRAGCVIFAVILSAVLAATLTPVLLPSILSLGGDSVVGALGDYLASGSSAAEQLGDVLSAALAPAFFLVFFILISAILLIAYIVLSSLLFSDKALEKKNKSVPHTKPLFGVNIAAHVIFSLAIVSLVLMPVSYYITIAGEYVDASKTEETEEASLVEPVDNIALLTAYKASDSLLANSLTAAGKYINSTETEETQGTSFIEAAHNNALLNVYGVLGSPRSGFLKSVQTDGGETTTVQDSAEAMLPAVVLLMSSDAESLLSSSVLYQLADSAESNSYLNTLIGGLLSDAGTAWANGESFLSVDPIISSDNSLAASVYAVLSEGNNASEDLRSVGILYSFDQALVTASETEEESIDTIEQSFSEIAANATEESVAVAKEFLTEEILSSLGRIVENREGVYATAISDILDGFLAIKQDTSLTEEERQQKIETEVAAIARFLYMVENWETADIEECAEVIFSSEILQTVIINATNSGTINDPFNFITSSSRDLLTTVKRLLAKYGVEEGSVLYNSVIALATEQLSS